MKHGLFIKPTIFIASLMLFLLILPGMSLAAEPMEVAKASSGKPLQGLERIAPGSVEDTLKACLGRIPLDASVGQRMLAKQNCEQIEVERKGTALTF